MKKIIAVANQKGGVGKTTTAVNTAASMADMGYKVLLIDSDPQGNATSGVGINKRKIEADIYTALINKNHISQSIFKTAVDNLFVLAGSMNLAGAEIELADEEDRENILKILLKNVENDYDYIIIDCPPSLGLLTLNALCASNSIIVPIQCEFYALEGLSQLMNTIRQIKKRYNPLLDLEGVLLTMYDGRLNLTIQVANEVKRFFPGKVFSTVIPRSVRLSEAPSFGQPIGQYDKNSKGAAAYRTFAEEVIAQNK